MKRILVRHTELSCLEVPTRTIASNIYICVYKRQLFRSSSVPWDEVAILAETPPSKSWMNIRQFMLKRFHIKSDEQPCL